MKPIEFPEQNCVYAKDQPQYLPLPVHRTPDGEVISCWQMSFLERLRVLITGRVWWHQITFNHPLQPQFAQVTRPFANEYSPAPERRTPPSALHTRPSPLKT